MTSDNQEDFIEKGTNTFIATWWGGEPCKRSFPFHRRKWKGQFNSFPQQNCPTSFSDFFHRGTPSFLRRGKPVASPLDLQVGISSSQQDEKCIIYFNVLILGPSKHISSLQEANDNTTNLLNFKETQVHCLPVCTDCFSLPVFCFAVVGSMLFISSWNPKPKSYLPKC